MANFEREQVVLNRLESKGTTNDLTGDTVIVTWTATMAHGSLLDASDAEVALAGIAGAVKVIDCAPIGVYDYAVGDSVAVNVAEKGCVFNLDSLKTSDRGEVTEAALTGLAGNLNSFRTL